ncbi:uncharacterized protein LOC142064386 [Phalacrocorax aristotelis]|uniref:uncharacterized protein LOC142064386 n=1 Tax=Phalacrocorax aristotelis TaxID=126867 RepID=UPI003F4B75FA
MTSLNNSPETKPSIVSRMAGSITDYLRRQRVSPSLKFSEDWECKKWDNWDKVEEQLNLARGKMKDGKEKAIICKMLGTCLEAICQYKECKEREMQMLQEEAEQRKQQEILLSLQIEQLMKELGEEKEKCRKAEDKLELMITQASNTPDPVKICKVIVSPEDWDGNIWEDPDEEFSKESELDESEFKVGPITKTKVSAGPQGGKWRNTAETIPWDPLPLANLQEKYGRKTGESETEYLWRVSLTGGDRIMLDQGVAAGFWGPGVFLNEGPDPNTEPHSITRRVAYWAGGKDPWDRGEPAAIPIRSLSEVSAAVTKAACLQAMNDRGAHGNYPIAAPVNPQAMRPLIKGAPAVLKQYLIAKSHEIRQSIEHNTQEGQKSLRPIPTWAELMRGIVSRGREIRWDKLTPAGRSRAEADNRWIWQVKQTRQNPRHLPQSHKLPVEVVDPQKRHNGLWRKALALGIPRVAIRGQPTEIVLSLVRAFEKQRISGNPEQTKQPPTPKVLVNNPFSPFKEELQILKPKNE